MRFRLIFIICVTSVLFCVAGCTKNTPFGGDFNVGTTTSSTNQQSRDTKSVGDTVKQNETNDVRISTLPNDSENASTTVDADVGGSGVVYPTLDFSSGADLEPEFDVPDECNNDRDCGPYTCDDGKCKKGCLKQPDCSDGYYCNGFKAKCEKPSGCASDAQCSNGFKCLRSFGNICSLYCFNSDQCQTGYSCELGSCIRRIDCDNDNSCGEYRCNKEEQICFHGCFTKQQCSVGHVCDTTTFKCVSEKTCSTSDNCQGYRCEEGRCRTSCRWTNDCADDRYCELAAWFVGICSEKIACETPAPCGGYRCNINQGYCRTRCSPGVGCGIGYFCQGLDCIKEIPCSDDTPCKGMVCDKAQGRCFGGCLVDAHCVTGHACTDYRCVKK